MTRFIKRLWLKVIRLFNRKVKVVDSTTTNTEGK
jgi:hypothetical protein